MNKRKAVNRTIAIIVLIITVITLSPSDIFASNGKNIARDLFATSSKADLVVHYVDVGQGDGIVIQNDGKNMLIDTGDNISYNNIVLYLRSLKIKKLDYLVITHPHADHIGKLDDIMDEFDVNKIYMPKIPNKYVPTSKTYLSALEAIKKQKLKITPLVKDTSLDFGDAKVNLIYTPNSDSNLNNYSIITHIKHDKHKFLFMGDAEIKQEKMLMKQMNVDADVLKIGHHGSKYSSSTQFIEEVSPQIGIISVGTKNRYSHPDKKTVTSIKNQDVKVYQTKDSGTIIVKSDGDKLTTKTKKPAKSIKSLISSVFN